MIGLLTGMGIGKIIGMAAGPEKNRAISEYNKKHGKDSFAHAAAKAKMKSHGK